MRLFPSSIVGRTALVLLLGLTVSHLVSLAIYSGDRRAELTSFGGKQISRRIAAAVETIERTPSGRKREVAGSLWGSGFSLTLTGTSALKADGDTGWRTRAVRENLKEALEGYEADRIRIAYTRFPDTEPDKAVGAEPPERSGDWRSAMRRRMGRMMSDDDDGDPLRAMQRHMGRMASDGDGSGSKRFMSLSRRWHGAEVLEVSIRLSDGQWLNVAAPAVRFAPFWGSRSFGSMFFMSLLVIVVSVWAVRRATAPLALFEKAAERLGRDVNAPPMNEEGPREVRRAARSFNNMQKRLKAFIEDRTHMLAAISHDLRTPITRLRLRAELIEDEEQQKKILDDLAQMEEMIVATLSFARDETDGEADIRFDLAAMLQSLCDDAADSGSKTSYRGPDRLTCTGRPVALMRAFQNLIDNAVKYGGRADVALEQDGQTVRVYFDDQGPGIPETERARVFDPFYRVEGSRNRETGGVGLGLAVVRSVVSAHGGDISFGSNDDGGFRVTVILPIS